MRMSFFWLAALVFACAGKADPAAAAEYSRKDTICPNHANLTALNEQNALIQLGDKFYYSSFHRDANKSDADPDFKLSWKEATEWCQQHAMELISLDSQTELILLQTNLLQIAVNRTKPVPDLYWTSGMRTPGTNRMHEVEIGAQVYDRFKWTGTRDYIRDSEIYKATRPGDCVVLNTYYIYIAHDGRLKKYARDCQRHSSFICELEKTECLQQDV